MDGKEADAHEQERSVVWMDGVEWRERWDVGRSQAGELSGAGAQAPSCGTR
jgi:hypothetical protein